MLYCISLFYANHGNEFCVFVFSTDINYKNEIKVKEAGKLKIEGKDYIVKDGDVMHFRFNV